MAEGTDNASSGINEDSPDPSGESKGTASVAKQLENLSEPTQQTLSVMMRRISSVSEPSYSIVEKLNEQHIDKFLDYTHQEDQNLFKYQSSNRWFGLIRLFLILAVFVGLAILFREDQQLLLQLVEWLFIAGGGFGGGYGYKAWKERDRS